MAGNHISELLLIGYFLAYSIYISIVFVCLLYNLRRYHRYEYDRNKCTMLVQFLLFQSVSVITIFFNSAIYQSHSIMFRETGKDVKMNELYFYRYLC